MSLLQEGDSFRYLISPFNIQSFSLHDDMPILILGMENNGILAIHAFSFKILFAIDVASLLKVKLNYVIQAY